MFEKVIFTIVSNNYFARALALISSLKETNPDVPIYIGLADEKSDKISYLSNDYRMIYLNELPCDELEQMKFKYDLVEFNTAIKPFIFKKLMEDGYKKIVYLDPDIFVYHNLDFLFDLLNQYSILLTPHRNCPIIDEGDAKEEVEVASAGVFNLGFCAISSSESGHRIVKWWCNKLKNYCFVDYKHGLFYDQKWMDFIPCLFTEDFYVLRDPGFNIAHWNFSEREITKVNGGYMVNDLDGRKSPLYFFHYSGFNLHTEGYVVQKHIDHIAASDVLQPLMDDYATRLISAKQEDYSGIPYAYNTYDNGDKITTLHRQLFRALEADGKNYSDLFSAKGSFYSCLKKSKLLMNEKEITKKSNVSNLDRKSKKVNSLLKAAKKILGIRRYMMLMRYMSFASRYDKQTFLLKQEK